MNNDSDKICMRCGHIYEQTNSSFCSNCGDELIDMVNRKVLTRRGSFELNFSELVYNPEKFQPIFAEFVPIEATNYSLNFTVNYVGYSKLFDEIEASDITPRYDVVFNSPGGFSFKRKIEKE